MTHDPRSRRSETSNGLASVVLLTACLLTPLTTHAQHDPGESPGGEPHRVHALVGARIVPAPGQVIDEGTIVIRDGVIETVGVRVTPPADARVWDMRGYTVYAGLIEPYLRLPAGEPAKEGGGESETSDNDETRGAGHAHPKVTPEFSMAAHIDFKEADLDSLRAAGFTAGLMVPASGILRGQSALVSLNAGSPREQVVRAGVAQQVAFERSVWYSGEYPSSLMGSIALVRQTFVDARHAAEAHRAYKRRPAGQERPELNRALDALAPAIRGEQPVMVEAEDAQMLLRGSRLFDEFGLKPWFVTGNSDSYRWLDEVQALGSPLVISVNFPPAPRWEDDDERELIELETLRHWHLAPSNPRRLHEAGVRFALTSQGLKRRSEFRARVREAIERGLPADVALAGFTTEPARLFGVEKQLGTVTRGAVANLTVTDGDLFAEGTEIVEVWVDGRRHDADPRVAGDKQAKGTWDVELDELGRVAIRVKSEEGRLSGRAWSATAGDTLELTDVRVWRGKLRLALPAPLTAHESEVELVATIDGRRLRGSWRSGPRSGAALGMRSPDEDEEDDDEENVGKRDALEAAAAMRWPPGPEVAPPAVLVQGATVWTLGERGTLENTDLLIRAGSIVSIGKDIKAPGNALIIDGRGKHVTPGIIDCHSHSCASGAVNECTNNCTAEVRIADVVNAETVRIYQQLAGGVTAANILHGSCNAIGGQNAVIKLRWGQPAHRLLIADAAPGIKFALGENPKRSNWDDQPYPRYPNSRMGVEQSIRERFLAARNYLREHEAWRRSSSRDRVPPRRDLQLEALGEILRGERLVHSHSYRQDEILMLIRVAEEFGFTIGTFQHVLEGYKVADELAAHGAGASCFSDWWAYKFEVYDAIPHNGAIMWDRGVLVSFNSDSSELARRLNLEAAKAVRYGGVPPDEALAFVTRNPAQQLRIDKRVGSLAPGMDGDFVVWSGDPLSTRTVCEETWIEGRRYFQRRRDHDARAEATEARRTLLAAAERAQRGKGQQAFDWQLTFGERWAQTEEEAGHELLQGVCAVEH